MLCLRRGCAVVAGVAVPPRRSSSRPSSVSTCGLDSFPRRGKPRAERGNSRPQAGPSPFGGRCPEGADEGRLRVTLLCNAKCCACGAGVLWVAGFAVSPRRSSSRPSSVPAGQRSTCGAQNLLRAFACLQILTAALPAAFLPLPPAAEGHRPPGGGSPGLWPGEGAAVVQSPPLPCNAKRRVRKPAPPFFTLTPYPLCPRPRPVL